MNILGYGEDALTLWALKNNLAEMLVKLKDNSNPDNCLVFYRPSFGRGGRGKANFGEFDFILLGDETVYLGESKWDNLKGHVAPSIFSLKPVQIRRHRIMKFYIQEWAYGEHTNWIEFVETGLPKLEQLGYDKSIAPADSVLRTNLEHILGVIRQKYDEMPAICNVFLFLHQGVKSENIPGVASGNFDVVSIDCSEYLVGNFITLNS